MKFILLDKLLLFALVIISISDASVTKSQIPMRMWMKQKEIRTTEEFITRMGRPRPPPGARLTPEELSLFVNTTQTGSFNQAAVERMADVVADPDVCEPAMRSVPIPPDSNPLVMLWPSCTRIEQCGGCCGHDVLKCVPTETEDVVVQVMRYLYHADGDYFDYTGNVDVTLTRHLDCDCNCRQRAEDCNTDIQYYDQVECLCRCNNEDQSGNCKAPRIWSNALCRCVCPELINCLDNECFDVNTCQCKPSLPSGHAGAAGAAVAVPATVTKTNPCASHTCRANYHAEMSNGRCTCRIN